VAVIRARVAVATMILAVTLFAASDASAFITSTIGGAAPRRPQRAIAAGDRHAGPLPGRVPRPSEGRWSCQKAPHRRRFAVSTHQRGSTIGIR
jgi:hypothetical protein